MFVYFNSSEQLEWVVSCCYPEEIRLREVKILAPGHLLGRYVLGTETDGCHHSLKRG